MDIRFVAPNLRSLDDAAAELCACAIWNDERPMRGLAGLLDWRLSGRLSSLQQSGFLHGDRGEVLLVPGKPRLPFDKVLVLGIGARTSFGEDVYRQSIERLARTLVGVRIRRAFVELPGRAADMIGPERAVSLMLECLGASTDHDAWWLVESVAAQRRIEQRMVEEPRRTYGRR